MLGTKCCKRCVDEFASHHVEASELSQVSLAVVGGDWREWFWIAMLDSIIKPLKVVANRFTQCAAVTWTPRLQKLGVDQTLELRPSLRDLFRWDRYAADGARLASVQDSPSLRTGCEWKEHPLNATRQVLGSWHPRVLGNVSTSSGLRFLVPFIVPLGR